MFGDRFAMLLPVLSRAKTKAYDVACRSNLRQLTVGWLTYLDENEGRLPPNNGGGDAGAPPGDWVLGSAKTDLDTTNIQQGVLYRVGDEGLGRAGQGALRAGREPFHDRCLAGSGFGGKGGRPP